MNTPDFTVDIFQNEYLPGRAREVNAIVTVRSGGSAAEGSVAQPSAAEIIIIDRSGSMGMSIDRPGSMLMPMAKLDMACRAAGAAIDAIRDGVAFAVIAGSQRAQAIYPEDGTLAIAGANTRKAAKARLPG